MMRLFTRFNPRYFFPVLIVLSAVAYALPEEYRFYALAVIVIMAIWGWIAECYQQKLLRHYRDITHAVSQGDLEARVNLLDIPSYHQQVADSINRLIDVADAYIRESVTSADFAANGKFYRKILEQGLNGRWGVGAHTLNESADKVSLNLIATTRQAGDKLQISIQTVMDDLANSVGSLGHTAENLLQISSQARSDSDSLVTSSDDTAENLTQIAAAVEELSTSIQEINRHIHHLNGISQDTQEQSHGAQEMLLELVKSTEEIGEVSELISSIAEQVNLLALNATIEAARAGEAGKGFAVVASEVKDLANQTAQATSDVDARIKTVSEGVKQTAAKQTVIASKIKEISESCAGIAAAADEQGATANEISSGLQHISQQTQLLKGAVDQMAKGAQSTEEAANHMQDDSGRLSQSNMQLRAGIDQFVANLTQH